MARDGKKRDVPDRENAPRHLPIVPGHGIIAIATVTGR